MKLMIHLVLWMGWLLLAYFIVAALMMIRTELGEGEEFEAADGVLRTALIVTSIVSFGFGIGAIHIRKHLFWLRRKIDINDGGGRAIFLGFSMAALTGGGLSAIALFVPRVLWGETTMPYIGVFVGAVFLVLMFPSLPRKGNS